jgi:hypothetical protein
MPPPLLLIVLGVALLSRHAQNLLPMGSITTAPGSNNPRICLKLTLLALKTPGFATETS